MTFVRCRPIFFQWQVSSFFGWGIYGLNLIRHMSQGVFFSPQTSVPFDPIQIELEPAEQEQIDPLLESSRSFQDSLAPFAGQRVTIDYPVLHALGHNLHTSCSSAHQIQLHSEQMVGVTFFEHATFSADLRERMKIYRRIITGSNWNAELLRAAGVDHVVRIIQGIDTTRFHPRSAPRRGSSSFVIFSGGKIEQRKGQDLVLRAFRAFRQRHDDAVLAVAWHCPWPHFALGAFVDQPDTYPIALGEDGRLDVVGWAVANGIPAEAIVDHGLVPNRRMPEIYRGVDVALFPNRAEGGTNLVAMEAMACGVPTILSANTGHLDLIYPGACLPLTRQTWLDREENRGWGESDVEEIVAALELLYQDRQHAEAIGSAGARMMQELDWRNQVCHLENELLGAFGV